MAVVIYVPLHGSSDSILDADSGLFVPLRKPDVVRVNGQRCARLKSVKQCRGEQHLVRFPNDEVMWVKAVKVEETIA